jgi:hypothetical protein
LHQAIEMNFELPVFVGRVVALLFALVIWPTAYFWLLWKLRRENVPFPPKFEFFVGLGTLGGWSLCLALAGSSPLFIVPITVFQFIIAIPASFYCLFRLARRPSPTRYHIAAKWILTGGVAIPIAAIALPILFSSSHP